MDLWAFGRCWALRRIEYLVTISQLDNYSLSIINKFAPGSHLVVTIHLSHCNLWVRPIVCGIKNKLHYSIPSIPKKSTDVTNWPKVLTTLYLPYCLGSCHAHTAPERAPPWVLNETPITFGCSSWFSGISIITIHKDPYCSDKLVSFLLAQLANWKKALRRNTSTYVVIICLQSKTLPSLSLGCTPKHKHQPPWMNGHCSHVCERIIHVSHSYARNNTNQPSGYAGHIASTTQK